MSIEIKRSNVLSICERLLVVAVSTDNGVGFPDGLICETYGLKPPEQKNTGQFIRWEMGVSNTVFESNKLLNFIKHIYFCPCYSQKQGWEFAPKLLLNMAIILEKTFSNKQIALVMPSKKITGDQVYNDVIKNLEKIDTKITVYNLYSN